jgi:glutaredoxin 3
VTKAAITLYVTGWCPYCQRAKQLLTEKSLVFNEINVDDDAEFRREMMARSGRRTVPQIFVGDKHVGGCDDLFALDCSGELDRLIQGA